MSESIFRAQTQNVRELDKAWKEGLRSVNSALRKNNETAAQVHTKVLVLVFSAWAEANFLKLVHTPHGFTLDEIDQIKNEWHHKGIGGGWQKCLELALRHVENRRKSNYIPNIRKKLSALVEDYVVKPGQVRNKVAHGQWAKALNRHNNAVNPDLTLSVSNLDVVSVTKWYEVHKMLATIIETLVESPNKAFHRDYWVELGRLEKYLEETANWTLQTRIRQLSKKRPQQPNHFARNSDS